MKFKRVKPKCKQLQLLLMKNFSERNKLLLSSILSWESFP